MLTIYKPSLEDLWFRQKMLEDEETMSYNHAYGGTISFPKEKWEGWYQRWMNDDKRYYRYLKVGNTFVGEISYHYDEEYKGYMVDVLIHSKYRHNGYGKEGLKLLMKIAKENGIDTLHDNIAIDNPALSLFIECGFIEEWYNDEIILLKKTL